jgi:hypothetical protein
MDKGAGHENNENVIGTENLNLSTVSSPPRPRPPTLASGTSVPGHRSFGRLSGWTVTESGNIDAVIPSGKLLQ